MLAGLPDVPGVTVIATARRHSRPSGMAAHAIRAGEGDVFIAAGVETVEPLRDTVPPTPGRTTSLFADAEARTVQRTPAAGEPWTPLDGATRRLHRAWVRPPRMWPSTRRSAARSRTSSPSSRRPGPSPPQESGFFEREIIPVTTPDGTVVTKDDGPRPGTTLEGLAGLKPVFREGGTVTAGNACPLNDGAAAVIVMSDTKARELGITPLARIVASGVSGLNPEIMGLGPVDAIRQTLARAG